MSKEEILELLDELTARLEGPAVHVFELAVRHELTGAILSLLGSLVLIVGGAIAVRFCVRTSKEVKAQNTNSYSSAGDGWEMLAIASGVAVLCGLINLFFAVHWLVNVEFNALRSLVPGL